MKMTLPLFLEQDWPLNAWIYEKHIKVYVRKSTHLIGDKMEKCLDVGSVEVVEKYRTRGVFKAFLSRFEDEARRRNRHVYVESILNPKLLNFLLGLGYQLIPGTSDLAPSVFKKV